MKFLIASLAFVACVCSSTASYGLSGYGGINYGASNYGASNYGGYAAHNLPAVVTNYALPLYNVPIYGPINYPAYGSNAAPISSDNSYGSYGSAPASSASAAVAASVVNNAKANIYGSPLVANNYKSYV